MDKPIEAEFDVRIAPDDLCAVAGRHKSNLVVMPAELVGSCEEDFKTFLHSFGCALLLVNRAQPEDTARCRFSCVLPRIVIRSGLVWPFPTGHFDLVGVLMRAMPGI